MTENLMETVEKILEMKRAQKKKKCSCIHEDTSIQVGDKETIDANKRLKAVKDLGKKKNSVKLGNGEKFIPEPEIDEKDTIMKYQDAVY
jgi:hypothetical protein